MGRGMECDMGWNVHVCGARGSFPRSGVDSVVYGGSTSCFYVDCGEHIFLDAGSGLVNGSLLVADGRPVTILLSHVHIDHVLGLFECGLLYEEGREVRVYGETRQGHTICEQLRGLVGPPFWPVGLDDFPADVRFHELAPKSEFSIGAVRIAAERSCHPDQGVLLRLEGDGRALGYALDHEAALDEGSIADEFFRGCDLLVFDGNEKPGSERSGWGHSSWLQGVELAQRAGIKRVLVAHHGFERTDDELAREEEYARSTWEACSFAREGMVVEL